MITDSKLHCVFYITVTNYKANLNLFKFDAIPFYMLSEK